MRLKPLYRARFSAPRSWSVELVGARGTEAQSFLWTEGRCEGGIAASWRAANFPRRRTDDTQTPEFRGVLETDDGATILFAWHGYGRAAGGGASRLVGSMNHFTDDERYGWLNGAVFVVAGEVRHPHDADRAVDVVLDVSELVWEPLAA